LRKKPKEWKASDHGIIEFLQKTTKEKKRDGGGGVDRGKAPSPSLMLQASSGDAWMLRAAVGLACKRSNVGNKAPARDGDGSGVGKRVGRWQ
jgi:hypothetical protein